MASYEQNKKNKLWSVRFRDKIDGKEKNMRLSGFKTKKEAQAAYIEYEKEKEKRVEREKSEKAPCEILFSVLAESYMRNQKTRIKESSYISTESKLNKHILPFFGEKKISEITPLVVLEWQQSIDKYAYKHKRSLRTLLTSIYKYGERYYDITNVMNRVEPFRNLEPPKEMNYWTIDDFQKFMLACDDEFIKVLFKFLYITGCRKGECQAVKWSDIDFSKKQVRINKNITRKTADGPYKVVTPKNITSNRVIDIPASLCEDLRKLPKEDIAHFVFGGEHPISDKRIERAMKQYAEKAGIKCIRIHDIRHSCASHLIAQGVSIVAVSHRLGHKNIEQTLNTYSHLMPNEATRIVEIFEEV
ncbi:MAG: site-specific integrase [Clostridia bacterium]|nr:site-specific integrase [Clostridia bacterium]